MDPDIINFPLAFLARRPSKIDIGRRAPKCKTTIKQLAVSLHSWSHTPSGKRARNSSRSARCSCSSIYRYAVLASDDIRGRARNKTNGFDQIVLIPLYPQYSRATTGSSINDWNRQVKKQGLNIPTRLHAAIQIIPALLEAIVEILIIAGTLFWYLTGRYWSRFQRTWCSCELHSKRWSYQLHIEEQCAG